MTGPGRRRGQRLAGTAQDGTGARVPAPEAHGARAAHPRPSLLQSPARALLGRASPGIYYTAALPLPPVFYGGAGLLKPKGVYYTVGGSGGETLVGPKR